MNHIVITLKNNKLQMAEMNTNTAELLQQMIDIKKDMRTAIGNKGVTVVSGMESYPSAIESIQQEIIGGELKLPDGTKFKDSTFTTIPQFDTSAMTDMSSMFSGCINLITIPQFDTSNVTNMTNMFYRCTLTTVPLFDTSNVTSMQRMFTSCYKLTSVPQFDTSNVTDMTETFMYCTKLTSVPQFDTSNVTDMHETFRDCESLNSVPILNCSSAKTCSYMFASCLNLENIGGLIDLGKSISSATPLDSFMFHDCHKLTRQSCINIFNTIYDRGANGMDILTLYFEPNVFMKLLPDDIAIATNKGWSVASL
jgi:surface protein